MLKLSLLPRRYQLRKRDKRGYLALLSFLCLMSLFLLACDSGNSVQSTHRQMVQTDTGDTISYSTQPQDVLARIFFGGGKVGTLQLTPEISIYGDGSFITGPGLQLRKGSLSSEALQKLLQNLTNTNHLLKLHRQIFNDIPNQNVTLLQVVLNNKNYQFLYGAFSNLQESDQDMQEYKQLGAAISTIRNGLTGPTTTYTSQNKALLVYATSRADFTEVESSSIPQWTLSGISLANTAAYECGLIQPDPNNPRTNLDNGCLTYVIPLAVFQPAQQDLRPINQLLRGQQQSMFRENDGYYVVMLRQLLPDEIAHQQLAMYGSDTQDYLPVPLKKGPVPVPTTGN